MAVRPRPYGLVAEGTDGFLRFSASADYSEQLGISVGVMLASILGENAAVGILLSGGDHRREVLLNAGFQMDERQRFILTVGQMEQFHEYAFRSGDERIGVKQRSGGVSYELHLGQEFLRYLEFNGYMAEADSRRLADKSFAVDTATLYELWNDRRRIAGGEVTGARLRLAFSPLENGLFKISLGQERLRYDLTTGSDSVTRAS